MQKLNARQYVSRLAVIAFLTLGIASTSVVTSLQTASAASSMINLWAVPTNSCIDDGKLQFLRLKFTDTSGKALEKIRITLDGTRILEFDANGKVLFSDPAFVSVDGSTKVKLETEDGYLVVKQIKGKFKIGIDKTALSVGEHDALAEIFVEGQVTPTLSDEASFKLKDCESGKPDIKAEFYGAPNNIKQDKKYNTFFIERNIGTGNAGEHQVKVFLSSDDELDDDDVLVGEKNVNKLKKGNLKLVHVQIELPDDSDLGPMFLIAMADADEEQDEINENNNIEVEEINVTENKDKWPEGEDEEGEDENEEDED